MEKSNCIDGSFLYYFWNCVCKYNLRGFFFVEELIDMNKILGQLVSVMAQQTNYIKEISKSLDRLVSDNNIAYLVKDK